MDIEKLRETLLANGIDEEKADKIIADLAAENNGEGETQVDGNPQEEVPPTNPDQEGDVNETPVNENVDGNPSEEGDVPQEGDVPPVPPTEEEVPPTDVPPTEVPPTEEIPPVPQEEGALPPDVPPAVPDVAELLNKIEEQAKTIEGLGSRIASLEDALQKSGVLESDNENSIGIHESNIPGSGSTDALNPMASVLAKLNGNKHF